MKSLILVVALIFVAPSAVFGQSPAVSKILSPFYPSSCSDPRAIADMMWGIPRVTSPLPAPISELHPTEFWIGVGQRKSINTHPLTEMEYGDYMNCLMTGKLSDGETINGQYTQWTNLAPETHFKDGKNVGTYVQFIGVIYDSRKYTSEQAAKGGPFFRSGDLELDFVFPLGGSMPCFSQFQNCGGQ